MKNRFTLTELILIAAVIGLLATIISTSLVEARKKAKLTSCIHNMKQQGIALNLDINDREEIEPEVFYQGTGDYYNEANHLENLLPYMEIKALFCPLGDKNENDYAFAGIGGWSAGYTYYYNPSARTGMASENVVSGDASPAWSQYSSEKEHYHALMAGGSVSRKAKTFAGFSRWLNLAEIYP